MSLTEALGFEYIWIDALCVIQDDLADWRAEAAKMHSVYRDAVLTISAAASKGVDKGCFITRETELNG
jgi:hypothetical protein